MFIEASVTPAKASRSASRGLIGRRPPKRPIRPLASPPLIVNSPFLHKQVHPTVILLSQTQRAAVSVRPSSPPEGGRRRRPGAAALSARRPETLDYRKKFQVHPGDKVKLNK